MINVSLARLLLCASHLWSRSKLHTCIPKLFTATAWSPWLGNGLAKMRRRSHLRELDFGLGLAILLSDTARLVQSSLSDGFPFHITFRLGGKGCAKQKVQHTVHRSFQQSLLSHSRPFGSRLKQYVSSRQESPCTLSNQIEVQ